MKSIEFNDTTLQVYDSIYQLPAYLHHQYSKYLIMERYIGSDQNSIDLHNYKIELWKEYKRDDLLALENICLAQCKHAIENKLNLAHIAFASLINTINEKPVKDYSEGNLMKIMKGLRCIKFTHENIQTHLNEINETLEREMKIAFPESVPKSTIINFNSLERKKQLLMHKFVQTQESSILQQIKQIEKSQSTFIEPKNFHPEHADYELNKLDTNFENNCIALESKGVINPKNLTIYEFKKRLQFYTPKNGQARQSPGK